VKIKVRGDKMKTVYDNGEGGVYIAKSDEESLQEYIARGYVLITEGPLMHYLEDRSVLAYQFD